MPPETPMPWSAKLTMQGARVGGSLLSFSKAVADERTERLHRLRFVGTRDLQRDLRSLAGSEHHDAHDAFRIDLAAVAHDLHVAVELRGELRELRRCARMQAQLVDDLDFASKHRLRRSDVENAFAAAGDRLP